MPTIHLDREFNMPKYSPVCCLCRWLEDIQGHRCKAFPGGIPGTIWRGQNNHTEAVRGDNGIRFEPIPNEE